MKAHQIPVDEITNANGNICNIVVGNHQYAEGIGEALYTLVSYLSPRYKTVISFDIVPSMINIFIDEFSLPGITDYLLKTKAEYPDTKFVILATELVTEIKLIGYNIGRTFNYFNHWEDRRYGFSMAAFRLGLRKTAPYMYQRYLGFTKLLEFADLVISLHPGILETLKLLPPPASLGAVPMVNLYPEIDLKQIINNRRLEQLPSGFVMTGTQTPSRQKVVKRLIETAHSIGIRGPLYQYLTFSEAGEYRLETGHAIVSFGLGKHEGNEGQVIKPFAMSPLPATKTHPEIEQNRDERMTRERLYNINPPRSANWPYSSPMRILRAVLFGYVPVLTQKFHDHELESVALLWDLSSTSLCKLWLDATIGRRNLIETYVATIAEYNKVAQKKNEALDEAFQILLAAPRRGHAEMGEIR